MPSNSHCRRTLILGLPRSTSARISSIEQTDFFFEPVQLHLQPPNFFVQRVAGSFPVPPFATVHEKLRKLFQRTLPPFRNLDRMHLELRTQLTQRLLAAHRLDRNPRFELRTILLSRRRHRPLLCQRLRRNLTLLPGLKSGDHYSDQRPFFGSLPSSTRPLTMHSISSTTAAEIGSSHPAWSSRYTIPLSLIPRLFQT